MHRSNPGRLLLHGLGALLLASGLSPSAAATQQAPEMRCGPIEGFTTRAHPFQAEQALPRGREVVLTMEHWPPPGHSGGGATSQWRVDWDPVGLVEARGSSATYRFPRAERRRVRATLLPLGRVVERPVEVIDVDPRRFPLRLDLRPQLPFDLAEDAGNAETVRAWFAFESIAALTPYKDGYATSIRRTLTALPVTPGRSIAQSLVEWRTKGRVLGVGEQTLWSPRGRQELEAGPPAAPERLVLYGYEVHVESAFAEGEIPEDVPVTFKARTDPPGFESMVTWLSATKYGSAEPTLGRGPEFTVVFSNTWGRTEQGDLFQWLGCRGDSGIQGQDGRCDELVLSGPDDKEVCPGDSPTYTVVVVSGEPPYHYEWWHNGVRVGADAPSYSPYQVDEDDEGIIRCVVSDSCGQQEPSRDALLTVVDPVQLSGMVDAEVCPGEDAHFSVVASDGLPPYNYAWTKNGVAVGGDAPNLTLANVGPADDDAVIRCVVTDQCDDTADDQATLVVLEPVITMQCEDFPKQGLVATGGLLQIVGDFTVPGHQLTCFAKNCLDPDEPDWSVPGSAPGSGPQYDFHKVGPAPTPGTRLLYDFAPENYPVKARFDDGTELFVYLQVFTPAKEGIKLQLTEKTEELFDWIRRIPLLNRYLKLEQKRGFSLKFNNGFEEELQSRVTVDYVWDASLAGGVGVGARVPLASTVAILLPPFIIEAGLFLWVDARAECSLGVVKTVDDFEVTGDFNLGGSLAIGGEVDVGSGFVKFIARGKSGVSANIGWNADPEPPELSIDGSVQWDGLTIEVVDSWFWGTFEDTDSYTLVDPAVADFGPVTVVPWN